MATPPLPRLRPDTATASAASPAFPQPVAAAPAFEPGFVAPQPAPAVAPVLDPELDQVMANVDQILAGQRAAAPAAVAPAGTVAQPQVIQPQPQVYGAQTYGLYILRDYVGLSDTESTAVAAQVGIVLLVGVLLSALASGWLSDKVGRRKPFIVWSSVVMAIALAVPLFVPTVTGVLAYSFLLGLGFGTYISIDLALMTEVLPARLASKQTTAGRDLALLGLATTLPQALSPSIAAGLVSVTGGYPAVFVSGIVFVIVGAIAVLPIKSVR